jgi:hypothetical protein
MSDSALRDSVAPSRVEPIPLQEVYPDALRRREAKLVEDRRDTIGLSKDLECQAGVGLSGGGIRSATFALGLFQGLAKRGLLRHIDYLSTVSGGGYFGSFYGRLLSRKFVETPDDAEDVLLGRKQPEVMRALRENGRYLSPNGGGDSLLFGATVVRNWVSIHLVLGVFWLGIFLAIQGLRAALDLTMISDYLPQGGLIWWSPLTFLPIVTLVFGAIPLSWAYWLVEPERLAINKADPSKSSRAEREASPIPPLAALALTFVTAVWLAITRSQSSFKPAWGTLAAVCLLTFVAWRLAPWRLPDDHNLEEGSPERKMDQALYRDLGLRSRLGIWVTVALVLTVLALALALVDSLGQSVYAALTGAGGLGPWLTAIFSSLGVLAGFSRWIAMFFSKGSKQSRPSLPMKLVAGIAALLVVLVLLVGLNVAAQAVAFGLRPPQGAPQRLIEALRDERSYAVRIGAGGVGGIGGALDLSLCVDSATGCKPAEAKKQAGRDAWRVIVGLVACFLVSILWGQTWPFVNRSSHLPLYAARLTRAYLGASNPKRWGRRNITEPVEGDDTDLARYWPPPAATGAPIHLINVTINETIDGHSQVQQQDRKGLGLTLGPWGLSAGAKHHAVMPLGDNNKMNPEGERICEIFPRREDRSGSGAEGQAEISQPFRVFDFPTIDGAKRFTGEALPLGTWLSISGAAFSTGTGLRTSLALSLLAGFSNIRLGRWWDSGVIRPKPVPPVRRKISLRLEDLVARLFPVQVFMLDEFVARFPGTARQHWYLSDGGHFENMGGYELLRRRLRFVLIVDGEMDADSSFEGLANLVRKARIDFGAEVRFLSASDLDSAVTEKVRPYIGTLEQLKRGKWADTEPATVASRATKEKPDLSLKAPRGRLVELDRAGRSLAHAALAEVTYGDGQTSWLLYVKPTLTGREPIDILEYHAAHPDFPHESTIDQFFDEAQWESYRRLGEYIADMLFGELGQLVPGSDPKGGDTLFKGKPAAKADAARPRATPEKGPTKSYS